MKNNTIVAFLLFSFIIIKQDYAQQYDNFYTIKANIENTYDSLLQVLGQDSMQGTDYYPNMRWLKYWEPIVYPSGDFQTEFQNQEQYVTDFLNGDFPASSASFELNYQFIGPSKMPDGGAAWGKGLGQIHYIAFDPSDPTFQRVFACSPIGGLWISENGGDTWNNAGTDKGIPLCGVSSIAIDPDSSNSWYITTGDGDALNRPGWQKTVGVWHTSDAGNSWSLLGLEDKVHMRKIILIKDQGTIHLFVTTRYGLFEWDESMVNPQFVQLLAGDFFDIEQDPLNPGIIYASGSGLNTSLYKIDWVNDSYTPLNNISAIADDQSRRLIIEISPGAPNYLFIVATYKEWPKKSYLYRYDLSSEDLFFKGQLPNSSNGEPGVGPERPMGWTISPILIDSELIMVYGNTAPIRQSNNLLDNSTCTWMDVSSSNVNNQYCTCKIHVDMHYMTFTSDGQQLWVGNDGGVYKSNMPDLTNNWEEKNNGLAVAAVMHSAVSEINENIALSGLYDDGSVMFNRNVDNWSQRHVVFRDGFQCHFDWSNVDRMFASSQYIVYRSENGGQTFQPTSSNLHFDTYFVQNEVLPNILYGTYQTGVKRSTDFGYLWYDHTTYPGVSNDKTWTVAVSPNHQDYIYSSWYGGSPHKIFKSTVGGGLNTSDWDDIGSPSVNKWINSITVDFYNPDIVWVAVDRYVFKVNTITKQWEDISTGLPSYLHIGKVEKVPGDNQNLFAGTSHGLYYYCDDNIWQYVNGDLPNVRVRDIQIDAVNNRIVVGTFGRGVWEADLPCKVNPQPINITTNETWTKDQYDIGTVTIESGNNLTILGSTAHLNNNAKIIVKRGAKLILDGGILTNACNHLWRGIEVWGDPTQPHTNESAHGVVELKNGAVIENAYCAITTTRRDENGQPVYGYHGGIIRAKQATFENNKRAIEFWPYDFENKSYFKKCTFVTSEALPDNNNFDYFIIMSDIDGVEIQGCDFENTRPASEVYMGSRGYGIYSIESQYTLSAFEQTDHDDKYNKFNKLNYGIKALGVSSAKTPTIEACTLLYNRTGIYLGGITSASVLGNYFKVESFDPDYDQNTYCGLYLDNSTQYHVEENFFEHDINTPQNEDHTIGITVNNSGEQDNEIYRNTFKTLDIGILAQNNNRDEDGSDGLFIKCNDFGDNNPADPSLHDNTIDIAVTCYPECINPGIKKSQGSDDDQASPAGNRFSQASNGIVDSDFSNPHTLRVLYYQHDPINEPRINLTYYIPLHVTKRQTDWSYEELLCCPPNYDPGGSGEMQGEMAGFQNDADSINALLNALVDGGNTQELENDVIFSTPDEAYALHSDLMMKSPYLTDTVMIEAINKEDVLNPVMVKEVLVANPQAAKSDEVMDELDNRINPLPDYMIAEIDQGNYTLSAKEIMEAAKQHYLHRKEIVTNDLKRLYKIDTTGQDYRDSLIDFLVNDNALKAKYELAFEYFNRSDYSNSDAVITSIPSGYNLNTWEDDVYQKYCDYFDIIIDLKQNNTFVHNLDSNQVNTLDSMSSDIYSYPGAYARNILLYNEIITYIEPYILPDSTLKFEEIGVPLRKASDDYLKFKVYPNPAKDFITIEYEPVSSNCDAYVEFLDLQGKSVSLVELPLGSYSKIIPLNNSFTSGTHICKLVKDGEVVEIKKITIIK